MLVPFNIEITDEEYERFRALIYKQIGVSLKHSKRSLLQGRLLRRLRHYGYEAFSQYYDYLKNNDPLGTEMQEMINAVTTNKTSFFREEHHFDILRERILMPAAKACLQGKQPQLRFWSAGCSSGEEPYSTAITIAESLERLTCWDVRILATDIDTAMLRTARQGIYPRESVSDLSDARLKRYFLKCEETGCVRVKPAIRELVRFAQLNLTQDSWPLHGKFDAIFCRNVIIYFDQDTQRRVLEHLAFYLKPGGILFAGHSENLFWLGNLLEPIGHTAYRVRDNSDAERIQ